MRKNYSTQKELYKCALSDVRTHGQRKKIVSTRMGTNREEVSKKGESEQEGGSGKNLGREQESVSEQ